MQEHIASPQDRDYTIQLHLPQGDPPARGHGLVWLLDTPTTWAPMQQALHADGNDDVVVVGIGWDEAGAVDPNLRRRDFTQPARHEVPPPRGAGDTWREDGDADAFLAFLTDVLQPRLLDSLPVDAARQTLVGHSLSGLFVLHALLARPNRFARFVAASPSIWWDQSRILDDAAEADWAAAQRARVLISVGSGEQVAGPEKPAEIDGEDEATMLGAQHMVDNAGAFAQLLNQRGVACELQVMEGLTHKSVLPDAMAAALAFARSGDPLPAD